MEMRFTAKEGKMNNFLINQIDSKKSLAYLERQQQACLDRITYYQSLIEAEEMKLHILMSQEKNVLQGQTASNNRQYSTELHNESTVTG